MYKTFIQQSQTIALRTCTVWKFTLCVSYKHMCYKHSLSLLVHMHHLQCRRKLCCPSPPKFMQKHEISEGTVNVAFTFTPTQLHPVTHLCMASIAPCPLSLPPLPPSHPPHLSQIVHLGEAMGTESLALNSKIGSFERDLEILLQSANVVRQ